MTTVDEPLTWEDSYAIALELIRRHPRVQLEDVSLEMVYRWTIELPNFADEKQLVNDSILSAIFQEWFEEVSSQ
jgi:FeS assembly protein IscX